MDLILFYLLGGVTVAASLLVVGQRNPMYSVLLLIASFGALAGLYVLLDAPFVAVIQIIIYAGAIMVVFLFVVMLLNAPREEPAALDTFEAFGGRGARWLGAALAVALGLELVWALAAMAGAGSTEAAGAPPSASVQEIGRLLFTDYGFAVQATAVLTLVAMIGAIVLAAKQPARADRTDEGARQQRAGVGPRER